MMSNDSGQLQRDVTGYIIGFCLSVILTLAAYSVVTLGSLTIAQEVTAILCLAIAQFVVQARFFLHIGQASQPRWSTAAFYFMLLIVLILVVGSLWIMANLDYNMATPEAIESQLIDDEGIEP